MALAAIWLEDSHGWDRCRPAEGRIVVTVPWATTGSSVVSALAAVFTARMAIETRRLARATELSAQGENASERRQQDAPLPHLD